MEAHVGRLVRGRARGPRERGLELERGLDARAHLVPAHPQDRHALHAGGGVRDVPRNAPGGHHHPAVRVPARGVRFRLAELAKLASPTPRPSLNDDQSETDMRIPMFLTLFIFAFCFRNSLYKSIRTLLLKYNKDMEIRRNISHEIYTIGVKEEVRHNLQLQHHPLIRSRTNLSKGELAV